MRNFTYKTWGGALKTIEADRVQFAPSHVVFIVDRKIDDPRPDISISEQPVGMPTEWSNRPKKTVDQIVRAVANTTCLDLEEVID